MAPAANAQYCGDPYYSGGYGHAYGRAYRDGHNQPPRYSYYQGRSYRSYRRCHDGDTGTVVGAIAGGLLGHAIAGRGDHPLGTVLGAGGGAFAGRAIERNSKCY